MKKIVISCITAVVLLFGVAASCEFSFLENRPASGGLSSEDVDTADLQKGGVSTPQNLFSDFLQMMDEVSTLSSTEIDNLSDDEVLEVGDPIQEATENTAYFDPEILAQLGEPLHELDENFSSLNGSQHRSLSLQVEELLDSGQMGEGKNSEEIREVLKLLSSGNYNLACSSLFNRQENYILLGVNDSFNIANQVCPAGSSFFIRSGIHSGQSVLSSKEGNSWIGLNGAVMDGENSIFRAFNEGMAGNRIGWIEIRNYHLHGIYSEHGSANVMMKKLKFLNIAPDSSGQYFGAIRFDNSRNLTVRESTFENVASAVRFRFSRGPLAVSYTHLTLPTIYSV